MVSSCSAHGCKNRCIARTDSKRITFHRFPVSKPDLLKKWTLAVRRENWEPNKGSLLCSEHFTADSFLSEHELPNSTRRRLKQDAVPSLFSLPLQKPQKKGNILRCFPLPEKQVNGHNRPGRRTKRQAVSSIAPCSERITEDCIKQTATEDSIKGTATVECMLEISTEDCTNESATEDCINQTATEDCKSQISTEDCVNERATEDCIFEIATEDCINKRETEESIFEIATEDCINKRETEDCINQTATEDCINQTIVTSVRLQPKVAPNVLHAVAVSPHLQNVVESKSVPALKVSKVKIPDIDAVLTSSSQSDLEPSVPTASVEPDSVAVPISGSECDIEVLVNNEIVPEDDVSAFTCYQVVVTEHSDQSLVSTNYCSDSIFQGSVPSLPSEQKYDTVEVTTLKRKLESASRKLEQCRKKIRMLTQSKRRLLKRNQKLKEVIKDLREKQILQEYDDDLSDLSS